MASRNETLKKIKETDVEVIRQEIMLKLEEKFQNEKERLADEFLEQFNKACKNIVELQEKGEIEEIGYIILTILRTRIVDKNYKFPIKVFNDLWWLDENQRDVYEYDGSFVFSFYEEMKSILEKEIKKYIGRTVKQDAESLLKKEIVNFLYYIARIAKYKILKATTTESFKNIRKCENLQIHVGEYLDFSELIYNEDSNKNLEVIHERLKLKKREDLCFEDLKKLNLEDWDLVDSDWRFSDVINSNLKNADLSYSLLAGVFFNDCNVENVDFSYCILNEANFENAKCKGAKFKKAIAYAGLEEPTYWEIVGFYPLNFTNADLEEADFTGADIRGAVFTGANLKGAIFDKVQLEYLNLTKEQKIEVREV